VTRLRGCARLANMMQRCARTRNHRGIRPDGSPITGLFAGGGVAAGVSGLAGAEGYASGNGLLTAVGLGYLAGITSAADSAADHA
jgi:hypothetical protein